MLQKTLVRFQLWLERRRLPLAERAARKKLHEEYLRYFPEHPKIFRVVKDEGVPAGPEIPVHHLKLHDMVGHACMCAMTDAVLRRGLRANAFRILGFQNTKKELVGITTIQPVYVEGLEAAV